MVSFQMIILGRFLGDHVGSPWQERPGFGFLNLNRMVSWMFRGRLLRNPHMGIANSRLI
jgi:hypothetical protein